MPVEILGKFGDFFLILQLENFQKRNFFRAISIKLLDFRFMPDKYFFNRRTVRKFTSREVTDKTLESILAAAVKAPTTGNMQLYSVVVTREEEMRKRLAATHFNQPAATGAPVMLTVCADLYRFTRWCELNNADACFDNFLSFTSAFADALILAQQIVTVAEMQGLGTCYLGTVTYNAPEISEILQLPRLTVPVACLALGYPSGEGEETERLEVEGILHKETYRPYSDEEIIEIFKAKDEYAPNAKFVEENGKQNLAQVFAEVRYPRAMNEEFSVKFLEFLKKQGVLK